MMTRIVAVTSAPIAFTSEASPPVARLVRASASQWRAMPAWLSVNVRKTLIEYMTTRSRDRAVRVGEDGRGREPHRSTPFWVTSRSDRFLKRCGTHLSTAIAASVRGPSTNPVCAATNSSAPSETSVIATTTGPISSVPRRQDPAS